MRSGLSTRGIVGQNGSCTQDHRNRLSRYRNRLLCSGASTLTSGCGYWISVIMNLHATISGSKGEESESWSNHLSPG
jgi:hypothetical protein